MVLWNFDVFKFDITSDSLYYQFGCKISKKNAYFTI